MCSKATALLGLLAASATAQPDTTPCDNNGAYDTTGGTAACGGFNVNVKALVCGDGFSQSSCVAKWVNGGGENEWYYFMGAGAGLDAGMLPAACSAMPSGLAMVQYKPDGTPECYPVADLAGTTLTYTAGSGTQTPASVTLNFAEHSDPQGNTRNGYIVITSASSVGGFTTIADTNQASFYEVDVSAPLGGLPPPTPAPADTPAPSPSPGPDTTPCDDSAQETPTLLIVSGAINGVFLLVGIIWARASCQRRKAGALYSAMASPNDTNDDHLTSYEDDKDDLLAAVHPL